MCDSEKFDAVSSTEPAIQEIEVATMEPEPVADSSVSQYSPKVSPTVSVATEQVMPVTTVDETVVLASDFAPIKLENTSVCRLIPEVI